MSADSKKPNAKRKCKRKRPPRQLTLYGSAKKRRPKFRKLYTQASSHKIGAHKLQSAAEARIARVLFEMGLSFDTHGLLRVPKSKNKKNDGVSVEWLLEIVEDALISLGRDGDDEDKETERELVLAHAKRIFKKHLPCHARYDFRVQGENQRTGKFETHYIEYWGMHNPKAKINKRAMLRNVTRNVIEYTFIKKPVKEAVFYKGKNLISLHPSDLRKKESLEKKLKHLGNLVQKHTLEHYFC